MKQCKDTKTWNITLTCSPGASKEWSPNGSTISLGRSAPPRVHGGVLLSPCGGRQGPLHLRECRQIHRVQQLVQCQPSIQTDPFASRYSQIDMMGHPIYNFCHPADLTKLQATLNTGNRYFLFVVPLLHLLSLGVQYIFSKIIKNLFLYLYGTQIGQS